MTIASNELPDRLGDPEMDLRSDPSSDPKVRCDRRLPSPDFEELIEAMHASDPVGTRLGRHQFQTVASFGG